MKFSKDLLGTNLIIEIKDEIINQDDFIFCVEIVKKFENKYSRFIKNNELYTLNKNKSLYIEKEFYSILMLCNKISNLSEGYFDISVLPFLENSGYGISKKRIDESFGYKNIILSQKRSSSGSKEDDFLVTLKNNISIEIGSVGKGYLIDSIYTYLSKYYNHFIINFGGDIKTKGSFKIFLEGSNAGSSSSSESFGYVHLENASIASSNGDKRTFNSTHHLINDHKKLNTTDIKSTIFVTHNISAISDIISTALYVSPLDICKKILSEIPGIEAYIVFQNGVIYSTPGFNIK